MSVSSNLLQIRNTLPADVTLIAISKTHPTELIVEAYNEGQRDFGENKVQELSEKFDKLPKDINWHFIGHLQSNKVKYLAPYVHLIHGIDSFKLLEIINKEAIKNNRLINCFLQVHIAKEESKFGFSETELLNMLESELWMQLTNIQICGLMGMATFTENQILIKEEFTFLTDLFKKIKKTYFADFEYFKEISMGMSDDYLLAIECGSTMVRIGSSIFGHRVYSK